MKQICIKSFLFFFPFILFPSVFAENIDVSVSSQNIMMWEFFDLTIQISEEAEISGDIRVEGIDNFQIFSQKSGYSFRNINGNVQNISNITLSLRPITSWEFVLWPVSFETGSWIVESEETFTILVRNIWESSPTNENEEKEESIKDEENSASAAEEESIRWLRNIQVSPLWILFLLLAFFWFFYIALNSFLQSQKRNLSQNTKKLSYEDTDENKINEKQRLISSFLKLEKESEKISSWEFYTGFNSCIREVFIFLWYFDSQSLSVKELEKNPKIIKLDFFEIYKASYYGEYKKSHISQEKRKEYIDEILRFLRAY